MNSQSTNPLPGPSGNGVTPDPGLVRELHRVVGDALAAEHENRRAGGQRRLSAEDEHALATKLIADELRRVAKERYSAGDEPLDHVTEEAVVAAVIHRLFGLGRLQPLLDDPSVRDIHISGHRRTWLTLRDGRKIRGPEVADTNEELVELISTAARRLGRTERVWDQAHPALDLQLPNGDRLHALQGVSGRPTVTIRRHDWELCRLSQLVERGLCDEHLAGFLSAAVRAKCNLIVSGATSVGKTTLLRALLNEIPAAERLVTIEDSLELGLDRFETQHPDQETLEARPPNTEGAGAFTMAHLVREALRMDPDRVIVGEVRGDELLPMLLAMSQGNEGSMCSIHADSSRAVFERLTMYGAMTREQLRPETTNLLAAGALDLIVHLDKVIDTRRITSVREITGLGEGDQVASNELWHLDSRHDELAEPAMPPSEKLTARLEPAGFGPADFARGAGW